MAIVALPFNNKNQFRKYPLKQSSSLLSLEGIQFPDDLFVNASITTKYGRHKIFIKQIFLKKTLLRVTITSLVEDTPSEIVLGVFSGEITEDFTTLDLTPFVRNVSGNITVGSISSLDSLEGVFNFSYLSSAFEESVIFCYTPPAVSSITDRRKKELRGFVNFGVLTNISKTTNNTLKTTKFTALEPDTVFNLADTSSQLGNCPHTIIQKINGVVPFPIGEHESENDGNIYIAGILPIVFYGVPGSVENTFTPGKIGIDSGEITLNKLCTQKHKLLPPVDISGFTLDNSSFRDAYYNKPALEENSSPANYPFSIPARLASNFNAAQKPEYYYWPQFVKSSYYDLWPKPE